MLGFDGHDLNGFKKIVERLSKETWSEWRTLTHKEVRAYARCLLNLLPHTALPKETEAEIQTLLACLSASGLPLYDREFLAGEILKVIQEYEKEQADKKVVAPSDLTINDF